MAARKTTVQQASRLRSSTALRMTVRLALLVNLSLAGAAIHSIEAQTGTLQGTVSVSGANGQGERLPGANLQLRQATSSRIPLSTVTNDSGEYKFTDLAADLYTLEVSLAGFKPQTKSVTVRAGTTMVEDIRLEVEEVSGEVTIVADGDGLNITDAAPPASFKQDTLQTVPLVSERFQDALPLVPGVIRGPDGLLNVKGSRASQSGFTVNSANVEAFRKLAQEKVWPAYKQQFPELWEEIVATKV